MVRQFVSAAYFAVLIGGLGGAEAETLNDATLRTPDRLEAVRSLPTDGHVMLRTITHLRDACEEFGGYEYHVGFESLVVNSYVQKQGGRFCAAYMRENLRRDYVIEGLDPNATYRVYFMNEKGRPVEFGVIAPD